MENLLFIYGIVRIIGAVVCSRKAKERNRNAGGWGLFGFISPVFAMIWIHHLNTKSPWVKY